MPNTRPFIAGGLMSKSAAEAMSRNLTRDRDPEIWTFVDAKSPDPVTGGPRYSIQRVS